MILNFTRLYYIIPRQLGNQSCDMRAQPIRHLHVLLFLIMTLESDAISSNNDKDAKKAAKQAAKDERKAEKEARKAKAAEAAVRRELQH